MRYLVLIGRILFSLIFIATVMHTFSGAAIDAAHANGLPLATLLVPLAGILATVGGLSVLLGYRARFGALMIVVFLVPVTLVMHKFWGVADPQIAMQQQANFMKNVALIGAALMIVARGPGPVSLDA